MKTLSTTLVGAAIIAASFGFAQPAAARSNVGVYVGPGGVAISVDSYRRYCQDDWYRRRHWDHCSRFYGGGQYYPNAYHRNEHHRHHRHWNREHRRWDWD